MRGVRCLARSLRCCASDPADSQPKTLNLIWLKNNLLPSDWDAQHALFDEFDA